MKTRSIIPVRLAKSGYIILSAVVAAAGLLMIVFPTKSLALIGWFFGIAMLLFGAVKLVGYFSRDLYRLAFEHDFQAGILLIVLGVIVLLRPRNVVHFITIVFGVCLFLDALSKCRTAREAKAFGISKWWLVFAAALVTGLVSAVLIFCADVAAKGVVVLLGVAVFVESMMNLCVAILMVKVVDNQVPDSIEIYNVKRRFD